MVVRKPALCHKLHYVDDRLIFLKTLTFYGSQWETKKRYQFVKNR
jgi:hypothetical protein